MTIKIKGELINFSVPKIMGILNVTPDSFYDGGKYNSEKKILDQVEKMISSGADIIDVGGYSSRPGAKEISIENELSRVIPIIQLISKRFPNIIISIDTFRSKVANQAVNSGAHMINDISGGNLDSNMFKTVSKLDVPYILMHMRGSPKNMMNNTNYDDILNEIKNYFSERISKAKLDGVNDIIIDPGFGFSKTKEQNYKLMNRLEFLKEFKTPIVVGISRKSMIYKTLDTTPDKALNGSTILHTISLLKGANILRTHDVLEAVECVKIIRQLNL
jgi:dihydropteroate synthase|tara:strand:- start:1929 stop:2753 length:825 start_codon:yes stop_codon:yes gene_type:complete